MTIKLGFIYSKKKLSGLLTKLWTGSYCYHVVVVDEGAGKMYDQHLLYRRRNWPHYEDKQVILIEPPVEIKGSYLEERLDTDESVYGWRDYLLFSLRPVFHLFGRSTPNVGGTICSELIYYILKENGWQHTFSEVPSPADLEEVILGRRNAIDG